MDKTMSGFTRISLDGSWEFQFDPSDGQDPNALAEWRLAQVPMPWQAQFSDLRGPAGSPGIDAVLPGRVLDRELICISVRSTTMPRFG